MEIEPIAYFRSPFPEKFGIPRQAGLSPSVRGQIVFEPGFRNADAVRGLEGFDYIWLIWGFSANPAAATAGKTSFQPTVRPPRLGGNERVGVFASRSPFRPNSLGLSAVKVESIGDGPVINVQGADLMDGTPIYDIKPYVTYADSHPDARSGFVDERVWEPLEVSFPDRPVPDGLDLDALREVLSQDPRPRYHSDSQKVYGMSFNGCEVRFRVEEGIVQVVSIESIH
ncbi:MAG: tRNA (N6-threonylcarbamoyladenosine(37)-N6)-methyltransferase TrmO [Bacteroidales bacterium]|nr:tRNA (N6-threonylcarbamoyladenosine(37)-N6)-methyltransferase TrmO [Bacteroidales bacterium]